jgi:hypothetical protein
VGEVTWQKLPALPAYTNPCLHCQPSSAVAELDSEISVGFGDAHLSVNGTVVWDCEAWARVAPWADLFTFADAERCAAMWPDNDWRVVLHGALHGKTYQRQGPGMWVLVERNRGFA